MSRLTCQIRLREKNALEKRSKDMIAQCGVPLSFLNVETLVEIISIISRSPSLRQSIDWGRIFSDAVVDPRVVINEIEALKKDGIII